MSRTNIVVLLLVAVLMGTLFSVFTTNSESVIFARAFAEPGIAFKVSGTLTRFHMRDKEGEVREVILNKPKPTGLEQSESIDLYGRVVDGQFIAGEMLMKCPSKYNEQSHSLAETTDAP